MLAVVCLLGFIRYEAFLTTENLLNVVRQNSVVGLVALGMTFVILTGGQGSVLSTLVGVLLLGVIFNLFNLEGTISPWYQLVFRGVILLFVVVAQNRLTKLK